MTYLVAGKITGSIGLKGSVKVLITSSFIKNRFKKGAQVYIKKEDEYLPLTISSCTHKKGELYLVNFKEIDTIELAEKYKDELLFVIKDEKLLRKDEYYFIDLIGLEVFKEDGTFAGKIIDIKEFTNVYSFIIEFNNSTYNIPFNDFFVKEIDLENKKVTIHYIEGLF